MRTNRFALAARSGWPWPRAPRAQQPCCDRQRPRAAPGTPTPVGRADSPKADIRIGSDNFYESKLMGEIYAQVLENAGYTVERKFGLGSRQDRASRPSTPARSTSSPEYVGSGSRLLRQVEDQRRRPDQRATSSRPSIKPRALATVLGITPGQDTNALVVRKDTADSLSLTKMSDLAAVQDQLRWGLPPTATPTRSARAR